MGSQFVIVALGGAIGAMMRFAVVQAVVLLSGGASYWGTMAVNIVGSFAMGVIVGLAFTMGALSEATRAFLLIGLLGSFTTFSAFSLDFVLLWEAQRYGVAASYAIASTVASILALFFGLWLAR